jgi:6-phosphogluconolactonase/glucosamine-6-phosphate isomerase/deaminase
MAFLLVISNVDDVQANNPNNNLNIWSSYHIFWGDQFNVREDKDGVQPNSYYGLENAHYFDENKDEIDVWTNKHNIRENRQCVQQANNR